MSPSVSDVINFLAMLYDTGIGYSAIGTARSALSTFLLIDGRPAGEHKLVCRFMKGVFASRPALPRYQVTWDVSLVLNYLKGLHPPSSLSLKDLSLKLITLFALLAGQRHQTLNSLDVINMSISADYAKFRIADILKTTRPNHHVAEIVFPAYDKDERLCPVKYLIQYLKLTRDIRLSEKKLFISYISPHKAIGTGTISRWIKMVLSNSGIDLSIFSPHSTRAASASKAVDKVQLGTILRTVGWSSERTFARFYKKPIIKEGVFAKAVIDQ